MPQLGDAATTPQISSAIKILTIATFFSLSVWAFYEMRIKSSVLDPRMKAAVDTLRYPESTDIVIHSTYTGVSAIDYGLRFLITAFLPGATGFHDPAALVLSAYFLISFFTLFTIYTVEAGRAGAKGSMVYFTSIWAIFFQTVGGAVVIPLLHLFLVRWYWKPEYQSSRNQLSTGYARALVPSLVLGYLLPTIAVYWPFADPDLVLKQKLVAFWQITPFVVNILLVILERLLGNAGESRGSAAKTVQVNIDRIYIVCFLASALAHLGMIYAAKMWHLSFTRIFVPQTHMLDEGVADPLHYVFQIDYIGIFASGLILAFLAKWLLGDRSLSSGIGLGFILMAGSATVGPGATIAIVYLQRDKILSQVQSAGKIE